MSERVVLATSNQGKLREFKELLQLLDWRIVGQDELNIASVEETGLSFVENALIKARNAARHSGLAALADDSGLVVDALGGAPGVLSARYAGPDANDQKNIQQLLKDMRDVPDEDRTARFVCVIVWVRDAEDATPLMCEGRWPGLITREPRGHHGFGYDPVFWVPKLNGTAAELGPQTKNALSHRGQAMRALLARLQQR